MAKTTERNYTIAKEIYASYGVDTDKAVKALSTIPISMHCWQGDDVTGFESAGGSAGGGTLTTGNYPGKARTANELRADAQKAYSLIAGKHRFNIHAKYAETNGKQVDRDQLGPEHFADWIDWAKKQRIALDFNPTFFAHPKAASGFTLSHQDKATRAFWVRHGIASRRIAAAMGKALGKPAVNNIWIPDGYKDVPADRSAPRRFLEESLDKIMRAPVEKKWVMDAVEGKLFGIGSESYVTGSHEFYLGYAIKNNIMMCLDAGHFHPTETLADKISATLCHVDKLLLHVSRGVRWDSDHVVLFNDDLRDLAAEIIRGNHLPRVCIALDFFDASINRIAAWVIGMRNMQKALLTALLEPFATLCAMEQAGDYSSRLALMEEIKTLPMGAVWDHFCERNDVPAGMRWMDEVKRYEKGVLSKRYD